MEAKKKVTFEKVYYSIILHNDIRSHIRNFFNRVGEIKHPVTKGSAMTKFIKSRTCYLEQSDVYRFLDTEIPEIVTDLSPENLKHLIDLICYYVQSYQDGKLNVRSKKPGKKSK